MKLYQLINEYITFKQSIGAVFKSQAYVLRSFCRAMGDINITEVDPKSVLAFISGKGPVTIFWQKKFETLKGFYRFAISRGYDASSPLPTTVPKKPESMRPYMYSQEELRRLITATNTLESYRSPLQSTTYRTLLLTLYGTGMRISEAISLTLSDVDLFRSLITVRNTKFFKTRLVPTGPQLTEVLKSYASKRRQLRLPAGEDSTFFATHRGNTLYYNRVKDIWRRLRKCADIHREDGARYQPRIHDIRHSFALHRLIAWYREGADVQRMLPLSSTYLGHKGIANTQVYLSMIPELQEEALRRFEQYALSEVKHE